jgi:hypothetical protein
MRVPLVLAHSVSDQIQLCPKGVAGCPITDQDVGNFTGPAAQQTCTASLLNPRRHMTNQPLMALAPPRNRPELCHYRFSPSPTRETVTQLITVYLGGQCELSHTGVGDLPLDEASAKQVS